MFDALYETLDRTSRIEGRKYIILIGSGRDTFSKLTLDKILAKIKATPNVTIFTIGTGALLNEMGGRRMGGGMREINYLQAQNQLKTFASMTGGLSFSPIFQGELPDDFAQINNSIRNQYVLTYRPTNPPTTAATARSKSSWSTTKAIPSRCRTKRASPQVLRHRPRRLQRQTPRRTSGSASILVTGRDERATLCCYPWLAGIQPQSECAIDV
jgi:hypothetical protein